MRRVALVYPGSVPWIAQCLEGIRRYAKQKGGWHLLCSPPTLSGAEESALDLAAMRDWTGDAIIAVSNDHRELRRLRNRGIPSVNLAGGLAKSFGVPRVMVDHFQAGQLAADHLLGRGLTHLAFFGWNGLWYSQQRCAGFRHKAASAGVRCATHLRLPREEAQQKTWAKRVAEVAVWLRSLSHPTGIFAVHDYRAQLLVEACYEARLQILRDIAVIGMDNDITICEHSHPRLSSISRNSGQVGWQAAALIDRMMDGETPPKNDILLPPDAVVIRESTEMLYCDNLVVQSALEYMRAHLKDQFNIDQLAEKLGVSKRTIETHFRRKLQQTPHGLLNKLRVQHAQTLLQMPEKRSLQQIAEACGFGSESSFYEVFLRFVGRTPRQFTKQVRSDEEASISSAIEYSDHTGTWNALDPSGAD